MSGDARVRIIGGGMGGCEAAWQLAQRGIPVLLQEMRPVKPTPAHRSDKLAEIVCSNSFKANGLQTSSGILKEELRALGSLLIRLADEHRVPAGMALAVDREGFAEAVTAALEAEPLIELVREEAVDLDPGLPTIIATGPLTSGPLSEAIAALSGKQNLHFFDAIAPVLEAESIDRDIAWPQSRYDKGDGVYLNCPLDEAQYEEFIDDLLESSAVQLKDFEKSDFFEACLPIEEMARRGRKTPAFGPMKPVGLTDPRTGTRPHAVLQLRQDDAAAELYGMVGFQTNLRFPEQERIFGKIPGLGSARFERHGQMHRNAYVDPPEVIHANCRTKARPDVFIAGQLAGVEGYVESMATGLIAALNIAVDLGVLEPPAEQSDGTDSSKESAASAVAGGVSFLVPPADTMVGGLLRYVTNGERNDRQPMNANFGILPPLPLPPGKKKLRKLERKAAHSVRALASMDSWARAVGGPGMPTREVSELF